MNEARKIRRRHSAEFKERVLIDCDRADAAVAAVALAHGINANLVNKWRRLSRPALAAGASFVPVKPGEPESPVTGAQSSCIETQMRRGITAVQVR